MKFTAILIVTFVSFQVLLSACSQSFFEPKHNLPPSTQPEEAFFPNAQEAYKVFSETTLSCEEDDCPEYVGGLMYYAQLDSGYYGTGACSATLIDTDKILTNAHCVPHEIRQEGASCFDRIKFNLPANKKSPYEKLDCDRVIGFSADWGQGAQVDWAILKIKGVSARTPAPVNLSKIEPQKEIQIFKVDYNLDLIHHQRGRILKTHCKANTNHFLSRHYVGELSPLLNVSDCNHEIIKGNSGSGLFDADMKLVGVLSFGFEPDEENKSIVRTLFSDFSPNFGGGTNLSCVPYFLPASYQPSPLCEFDPRNYFQVARAYTDLVQSKNHTDYSVVGEQVLKSNLESLSQWIHFDPIERLDQDLSLKSSEGVTLPDSDQKTTEVSPTFVNLDTLSQADYVRIAIRDSLFVKFPSCIKATAPKKFRASMALRQIYGSETDQENLYVARNSLYVEDYFEFNKTDVGYRIRHIRNLFDGFKADYTGHFTWGQLLIETIPVCEE